jgi:hypothetical protein
MRRHVILLATIAGGLAWRAAAQVAYPPATPVMVQQAELTLDANGDTTWTFDPAFPQEPAIVHIPRAMDRVNPLICNFTASSATAVTVHCWRTNISGLLSGVLSGPPAGGKVKLLARSAP